ncbi:family 10 glycosylhydrolase [Capilliphycus salinus ALCB114379]|uniref:family 10 glycosylhydrolase n=1 Tax=Capilliphycus salinus TaxID=2768948 RepID=UPI0039A6193D
MKLRLTSKSWSSVRIKQARRALKYLLLVILAGWFAISGAIPGQAAVDPQPFQEIRGVWMTSNDSDILRDRPKVQEAVSQLGRLNFNTIYPVVWNSGYALYPSAVAQLAGIQPFIHRGLQGQDILRELSEIAHQQNLLVIPWFEFGFMAPPTSELALNHPNWLTQKRDGSQTWISAAGEVVWLNPFHPEVQKLITDLVLEVITQYNIDGIQFDDHLSLPNEFGYDPYTISLYRQQMNASPPANPQDPTWMRWRANQITAFVKKLNKAIKEKQPNAIFSVSPNPYHLAYNTYLQDWINWVKQDLVDELIVQVYRPDLNSFLSEIVRPEIQDVRKKIPTGVGILTGLRNRPVPMQHIQAKVQAARQQGLGMSFFFFESLWDDAPEPIQERKSNFEVLFNQPATRSVNSVTSSVSSENSPPSTN